MAYATWSEFKSESGITSDSEQTKVEGLLEAATAAIDGLCNRQFLADDTASTKLYRGKGESYLLIAECIEITQVEILSGGVWTALASSAWYAYAGDYLEPDFDETPYNGILTTGVLFPLPSTPMPTVRITAKWGYAASVPPTVKQAVLTQAHRWHKRGQSGWADTMANSELGITVYRKAVDPDVQMMLMNARLMRPAI